jgi:hypothetical protein
MGLSRCETSSSPLPLKAENTTSASTPPSHTHPPLPGHTLTSGTLSSGSKRCEQARHAFPTSAAASTHVSCVATTDVDRGSIHARYTLCDQCHCCLRLHSSSKLGHFSRLFPPLRALPRAKASPVQIVSQPPVSETKPFAVRESPRCDLTVLRSLPTRKSPALQPFGDDTNHRSAAYVTANRTS